MKMHRFLILALTLVFMTTVFAPVRAQDDTTAATTFYLADDGSFSVKLPEGWFAVGDATGLFGTTNEALLANDNLEVTESGDRAFLVIPLSTADLADLGIAPEATILEIATTLAPNFGDSDGSTEIGQPESLAEGVARMTIADDINDGVIYVVDNLAPGYIGIGIMAAVKGEMTEEVEIGILGIFAEINFSLPLDEPFLAADNAVGFSYPTDWVMNDFGGGVALLFDSQTTMDNSMADADIAPGESRIALIGIDPANVPAELTPDTLKAFAVQVATELTASSEHNPVVGEPDLLENELLVGGSVVHVSITSDIGEGGVFVVNNAGALYVVLFSGVLNEGNRLFGTALNIANTATYTPIAQ